MNRTEDLRLITGRGKYSSDWNLPRQAHAYFLRADRAHAEIVSLDAHRALQQPGVIGVLTGADVAAAGFRSLPCSLPYAGRNDEPLRAPHRPALAQGRVRYVGEPVALVVAETAAVAQDAAELIDIEYRDLPSAIDAAAALAPGAPQLHDGIAGNLAFDYDTGDEAAAERAFRSAHRTVRITLDSQRVVGNPMEPRACVAAFDAASAVYTLHVCTQGVAGLRGQIAAATGIGADKIRIVTEDVGGGFGVRFNVYPETCALMLAAARCRRPVKWTASRSEVFLSDEHGRAVTTECELALDRELRFTAMRFHFLCDLGAYATPTGAFINTRNPTDSMTGVYRVPALYGRFRLVYTNTVPVAAYRGAGRPLMSYALERLVDHAAAELGVDRVELRRRNLIPRDAFPYRTPNAGVYDCGDFEGVLDQALAASQWSGFEPRRADAARRGKLRGIGLASYIEASGAGFAPVDQVEIRFRADGEIALYAVTHSQGQGHETTFAQIVAGVTGLPRERFKLRAGDPDVALTGNATGGSRSLLGAGSVFRLAAEMVVEQGRALAARALGVAAAEIAFDAGTYRVRSSDRSITIEEIESRHRNAEPHPLSARAEAKFGITYPNGCHVAEVEIDPDTGVARVMRYTAVDDGGTIVNPGVVEGQMHGGVAQGAGQAFGEHAIYDRASGQLLAGSFADYPMPRAGVTRDFAVEEHPVPTQANPLGAKGVGEAGVTGSLPALMNAVLDALRPAGVTQLDMPATPARVWAALQAAPHGRRRQ